LIIDDDERIRDSMRTYFEADRCYLLAVDLKSVAADYFVLKSSDLGDLKVKIKTALESKVQVFQESKVDRVNGTGTLG